MAFDVGTLFIVIIVVVVTAAQLMGNSQRKKDKDESRDAGSNGSMASNTRENSGNRFKKEVYKDEKVRAEELPPSFEADNKERDHIQGFDVK